VGGLATRSNSRGGPSHVAHLMMRACQLSIQFQNHPCHCEPTGRANARPMTGSAKQSMAQQQRTLDCFVASAPRNDGALIPDTPSRSRRGFRAGFVRNVSPSSIRGRRECRMPDAPAASCALLELSMHTSIHSEFTGITRHSPRNGFTAYLYRALPGDRLFATVAGRIASTDLTRAPRRQDHTTSPSVSRQRPSSAPPRHGSCPS
jgi:hypothetical protein